MKTEYYVNRDHEKIYRLAKIVDGLPYGYVDKEWKFMPSLAKITQDVTSDYEKISEEEANKLIVLL